MAYTTKELALDPTQIKGMSEKLIVSHYENKYSGAVNRLNAITAHKLRQSGLQKSAWVRDQRAQARGTDCQ